MSQNYVQAFPYCFLEPCCLFSADPAWFVVGKLLSAISMFQCNCWEGWGHPQCIIKKQTATMAGHLKIRWDIVPDYIIDGTSSIKTLKITINFDWDKIT